MTLFKPCIDLHSGKVKQIVGGSLRDRESSQGDGPKTNFISEFGAGYYAQKYREDGLQGGHVICLGPGNDEAAREALAAYPGGLQIGGGIHADNAKAWLDAGASHVIVTSWLFPAGHFSSERLQALVKSVGANRLVIDLSCRRKGNAWFVAIDRWQTITPYELTAKFLEELADSCCEFLVHAADVEGLMAGMDVELIRHLAAISPLPLTYAGGARSLEDLALCEKESDGKLDLTIGSALDLFGGQGASYADCVAWNQKKSLPRRGIG